jgi:hypothetical protein
MRIKLTQIIIAFLATVANAQIYTPNGVIQGISGNNFVGIGTNTPGNKLDVYGNHNDSRILLHSYGTGSSTGQADLMLWASEPGLTYTGAGIGNNIHNFNNVSGGLKLLNSARGGSYLRLLDNSLSLNIVSSSGLDSQVITINASKNVGIGTANPSEKLEIYNSNTSPAVISLKSDRNDAQFVDVGRISAKQAAGEVARIGMPRSGESFSGFLTFWTKAGNTADLTEKVRITESGSVGIGVINPSNKLDVNGTIHSKEVKVDMIGWSDFVFGKEYNLPTLEEVEKHIEEKGHLENIPSEEEVLKNGINLGEMNAKLLQKIEELTLYMIEQNKRLENVEKENKDLRKIINTAKNKVK